jgi:P27 family predicted phage terminase small subunit
MTPPKHLPPDIASIWAETCKTYGTGSEAITGPALEAYCGQVARLRDAQRRIAAEGLVVADSKGQPVAHPALAIERSAQAEIRTWADTFRPKAWGR